MKKIIISLILVCALLIGFIPVNAQESDYDQWEPKYTNDTLKEWTIKFNQSLDEEFIVDDNIFIKDSSGKKVDTKLDINSDEKSVIIKPLNKYEQEKRYYLYVSNDIKSKTDKSLKKSIKMPFDIVPKIASFDNNTSGVLPGTKRVKIKLDTDNPQDYGIIFNEASLYYLNGAKVFYIEVNKEDAIKSNFIVVKKQ